MVLLRAPTEVDLNPIVAKTADLHNDFNKPILTFLFWFLTTFWANAKEHALIIVAYWDSCYAAYGLGPLSALELYYGCNINPGWGIYFLLTSQMIGYAFTRIHRDILVRPPNIYYPGGASLLWPVLTFAISGFLALYSFLLSSLPLLCYFGHGQWKAFLMGWGYYGFGVLDFTLDWNYASFLSPLYTPLWANSHQIACAIFCCWLLYPIMYFTSMTNSKNYPPMTSGTFDLTGNTYNISRTLTPDYTLNQTAMDAYSPPRWSTSYAMYFFFGFAASTAALAYSILWYGKESYKAFRDALRNVQDDYNDPYLKLMSRCIDGAEMGLPWWGFIVITLVSVICTFPNGMLWGVANVQVGMAFLSELVAGAMFPGNPTTVLTCMTYGRQILEQNLNLASDYKFGCYMKIPEKEMFWGQVHGTLLGPFINYGIMRLVIDRIGKETLIGKMDSNAWLASKTKSYYSLSVLWGILGPKVLFDEGSPYSWIYYSFLIGPALVAITYVVHKYKPGWSIETRCNMTMLLYGDTIFPVYGKTNLMTSDLLSLVFMGYILWVHPVWFRKYNYLLGTGLDRGTQVCATTIMFAINLPVSHDA
ncbi:OPT oligopeptide transporter protein-domain-containing protein [Diaporthe sp. PMI_573]|nr:OPT oligopeptide transporter protein-domain-containing protein [Diaporthaceae sp. PMI_573]